MSPLIPILGGLGVLYLVTRKSDDGDELASLGQAYDLVNSTQKTPLTVGAEYTLSLRYRNGTTPRDKGDVYVLAKCLEVTSPSTGKFQLLQVLNRWTPVQQGEPNLPAILAAGNKIVFSANDLQVEQVENLN